MSQQKELDADPKATQQIEFIGQLIDDGAQSMFVLMILEETKDTRPKLSQSSVTVFWKMPNYKEARNHKKSVEKTRVSSKKQD